MPRPEIDDLELELGGLEGSMAGVASVARTFSSELGDVRGTIGATVTDLGKLDRGISSGLRKAIDGLVLDGGSLKEAFRGLAKSMVDTVYSAAMQPVSDQVERFSGWRGGQSAFRPHAVRERGGVQPGPRLALRKGWSRVVPDSLSDARGDWPDGRGWARGDHAAGPGGRRSPRRPGPSRKPDLDHDERIDAGRRRVPAQPGPDRGPDVPDARSRRAIPLKETEHGLS